MEFAQRPLHGGDGFGTRGAVDDQFADHAVVVGRNAIAGVNVAVQPHARAAGDAQFLDQPGRWGEIPRRIFGVDAAFDRVADLPNILLLACSAATPAAMRICSLIRSMPVTCFGHRMLDLDAGVDFQQIIILRLIDQEFHRAGVGVLRRP